MHKLKEFIDSAYKALPFVQTVLKLFAGLLFIFLLLWLGWKANDFRDKICSTPLIGAICNG